MNIKDNNLKIAFHFFLIYGDGEIECLDIGDFLKYLDLPSSFNIKKYYHLFNFSDNKITLSKFGSSILSFKIPFYKTFIKNWDKKWRIISYEIPESKRSLRDKFRNQIEALGYRPWHRSFWISPHDSYYEVSAIASEININSYLQFFLAEHIGGDMVIMLNKVWGINKISNLYKNMYAKWHKILLSRLSSEMKLFKIINEYLYILKIDPAIPVEFFEHTNNTIEAWQSFKKIRKAIISTKP